MRKLTFISKKTIFSSAKLILVIAMILATLTASAQSIPREMTAEYYMSQPFTPDTAWHFSPGRYREMKFYRPGKAHVEITLDSIPEDLREHVTSVSLNAEDQILRRKITQSATLNADSRFVFDLDLAGPMTLFFESIGDIFVQPGDSLEVFAALEPAPYINISKHAFRSNGETAMINALMPKMLENLIVLQDGYRTIRNAVAEGKESCERLAEEWGTIPDRFLTSEEVRQKFINTPLSNFGKDLIVSFALAHTGELIEDIRIDYAKKSQISEQGADGQWTWRENPDFVPLDQAKVIAPLLRHRDLFYDNPLVLCTGWRYVNRSIYGGLFRNYESVKVKSGNGNIIYDRIYDHFGMRGTFMYDLSNSQFAAYKLQSIHQNIQLGNQQPAEAIDRASYQLADCLAEISYSAVAKAVLDEYRAVVAQLEGGKKAAEEDKWTAEQRALWKKITEPFAGNLLYVDFWGMGCGPCREGMISMRDKVEALKKDRIRFLYVCEEKYSPRAEAEKWMAENKIRGEHIYVTHDEWNQLQQMFNFTGIPHAALADKSGKVIQNGFFIEQHSADSLRQMIGKL